MNLEFQVYEDVVALDDTTALLTVGYSLANLDRLLLVNYVEKEQGRLEFTPIEVLATGGYLRLGNVVGGCAYFSDGGQPNNEGKVYKLDLLTKETTLVRTGPEGPHQPCFGPDEKLYYTGEAPEGKIYCDGEIFVDTYDNFREVTNPFIYNNFLYYEALLSEHYCNPLGWSIYRMNLETQEKEVVIKGANPSLYNGFLYYDIYQPDSRSFIAYRVRLGDLKENSGAEDYNKGMKIQALIDELYYPPTHTYQYNPLRPTGILAQRMSIIHQEFPSFFEKGTTFLDIGSSKGYVLKYAATLFDQVDGIEPNEANVNISKQFEEQNIHSYHGFWLEDFEAPVKYTRIYMGNVYHYLYNESGFNWDWVPKLAKMTEEGGLVCIEGPIQEKVFDNQELTTMIVKGYTDRQITPEELTNFTHSNFLNAMEPFYILEKTVNGVTSGRPNMLFRRK